MKILRTILSALTVLATLAGMAQSRSVQLSVNVTSIAGDNLYGQAIQLTQADYGVGYGTLKLDADGKCTVNVYPGNHKLEIDRKGYDHYETSFNIDAQAKTYSVDVTLTESTRAPFALTATQVHDAYTGRNDIAMTWNTEAPAFFDDFESYEPWSISFGEWTGIDADKAAAAPLVGNYPNRGVMQFAQIINPLTVEPTWWYDYPILRPYAGQQYLGMTRTSTGVANDDWLISPVVKVGTDNVLSFMAKAADQYDERYMVYVTEKTDNPGVNDFTRIDQGNFEAVDYRGWHEMSYDLTAYAGKSVKFAIRYISDASRYGAFMLMIDDVYVGQAANKAAKVAAAKVARRVAAKSPANAYESFEVYLDGQLKGTTESYSYTIADVAAGKHTVGVRSVYRQAKSDIVSTDVNIDANSYAVLTFNVSADSKLAPEGLELQLVDMGTAKTYSVNVIGGKATVASLPFGEYTVRVEEGAYTAFEKTITVNADMTVEISLTDNVIDPYNVTANVGEDGKLTLRWNQILGFSDSFETYDDFATGHFGDWYTYDADGKPVYPIALGDMSNIVSFPGSGNQLNPMPCAPMVFNPWKTVPAMMPDDTAIAAPTGDKTVVFFSAQLAANDKWLVSPEIDIYDGYVLRFLAKAYSPAYPESMQVGLSIDGPDPINFTIIGQIAQLESSAWGCYELPLSEFAGYRLRVGFNYTSQDAMLAQIDDVTVEPEEGSAESVDYGNVDHYEIYLDGTLHGTSVTPVYEIANFPEGTHTLGIKTVYKSAQSKMVEVTVGTGAVTDIKVDTADGPETLYDMQGRKIDSDNAAPGLYISVRNGVSTKKLIK